MILADLCNAFLNAKDRRLSAGDITSRTRAEYQQTTDLLIAKFGKSRPVDDLVAEDFEGLRADMADRWGPVRLAKSVQLVRTAFKCAYEAGLIEKPVRYGPHFKNPSAAVLRRHRAKNGERMFEPPELLAMLRPPASRYRR